LASGRRLAERKEIVKHRITVFKAITVMLFAGGLIAASSGTFAEGNITGSVRDLSNNRAIQGAIITAKEISTGMLAAKGVNETQCSTNTPP
jgi:hypothetical protein